MKRVERAAIVLKRLGEFYPNPAIPLAHSDAYSLLVAVLLSAQCTDKMVNRVMPALMKLADKPEKMAKQTPEAIREIIKPCGLSPQKSVAIHRLSKLLIEKHRGEVPDTFEELEQLPGVGHKTASVVMCQAFGHPAFPVDTHIHRLSQRWGLSSGRNVVQIERDLKQLFPESTWGLLHLQIIYYGREHCTARGCDGTLCPICRELYPNRKTPVVKRS
ncbi:MAG: endonuclease III [Pirellulaceae bacterium]|nr:endonuclease III [Pirellulaceae bacterium]